MTSGHLKRPLQRIVRQALWSIERPELLLWALYLITTPFYVWKSGRPQPADGLLLVVMALAFGQGRRPFPPFLRSSIALLFSFAGYAAMINLIWGVLLLDYEVVKVGALGFAAFYLFNALVFATSLQLFLRNGTRFIAATAWGTLAALLLQLALMASRGESDAFREKLFFNNPNQLGYYALLAASIIAFTYQRAKMPTGVAATALAAATLFAAASLSKAALIGTAMAACVAALRKPVLLLGTAAVVAAGLGIANPDALIERIRFRMTDMGQQEDDTLEGRGYSRIEMHPEYLVFGAAEVGHDRHGDFGGELHSSWATVLFSYGVVGFVLMLLFFWKSLRHLRPLDWVFTLPIFWYGMTHQGLRFRLFWVYVALLCIASFSVHAGRARQRAAFGTLRS